MQNFIELLNWFETIQIGRLTLEELKFVMQCEQLRVTDVNENIVKNLMKIKERYEARR